MTTIKQEIHIATQIMSCYGAVCNYALHIATYLLSIQAKCYIIVDLCILFNYLFHGAIDERRHV